MRYYPYLKNNKLTSYMLRDSIFLCQEKNYDRPRCTLGFIYSVLSESTLRETPRQPRQRVVRLPVASLGRCCLKLPITPGDAAWHSPSPEVTLRDTPRCPRQEQMRGVQRRLCTKT